MRSGPFPSALPNRRLRAALGLTVALGATSACSGTAEQPGSVSEAAATGSGTGTSVDVVATGLDTPRGLAWDPVTEHVLVTEAGRGGPAPCAPGVGGYPACFGLTGAVTAYDPAGGQSRRIAEGLPSVINEFSVLGLHDIAVRDGVTSVVFGMGGDLATREGLGASAIGLAQTGTLDGEGRLTATGDLLTFEQTANPHPADVNANAYGLVSAPEGTYVAEAGGNAILLVSPAGEVSMATAMPDQTIDGKTVESVPSAIALGPDGAYYISEYSGEPTVIGAARVWRWAPGTAPEVVHSGFTGIIDLTFDEQGRMLVLELAQEGFDAADRTGRLVRLEEDGQQVVIATTGLEHPGGVLATPGGDLYVTNRTTGLGDSSGELLRIVPAA